MAYQSKDQVELPELESVRRLRESVEGGPGSGPQGGKKSKKDVHSMMAHSGGFEHEGTSKDGTKTFGQMETDHKVSVHPDGSWEHTNQNGRTVGKGSGMDSLEKHMKSSDLGFSD